MALAGQDAESVDLTARRHRRARDCHPLASWRVHFPVCFERQLAVFNIRSLMVASSKTVIKEAAVLVAPSAGCHPLVFHPRSWLPSLCAAGRGVVARSRPGGGWN
jgi:hypothetical protein